MEETNELLVFIEKDIIKRGEKDDKLKKRVEKYFKIKELAEQVKNLESSLSEIITAKEKSDSSFQLQEVTINAEINANGKIGILGSGVSTGLKSGITFKFNRKSS